MGKRLTEIFQETALYLHVFLYVLFKN